MYHFYTDGSTKGNGTQNSYGAWGYVCLNDKEAELARDCAAEKITTNQRMELMALIKACEKASELFDSFTDVTFHSDSAYAMNCYHQHWYVNWQANGWKNSKKQPVANQDLWERLIPHFGKANFHFVKVKGHAGNKWNEVVDTMVQTAAQNLKDGG